MDIGVKVIATASIRIVYTDPIKEDDRDITGPDSPEIERVPVRVQEAIRDFFADLNEYNTTLYTKLTR